MINIIRSLITLFAIGITSQSVLASSSNVPLADINVATDQASLQRGFTEYYNLCRMCHQLKYVKYQYLNDIGFDKTKIDSLRGTSLVNESLRSTMPEEIAASVFGAVPPDLSLMAKARKQGPRYIYTLLTSYEEKAEGGYDNKLFHGIKMPDPYGYSVSTTDTGRANIEKRIKDVVAFLNWSADPQASERKTLGMYVIGYLFILSVLFFVIMKRVWGRLPPPVSENL